MNLIKKISYIFTRDQKIKFIVLFFLILGGAVAETVGVSMIMPFISIVADPESILEQPIFFYFYNLFNMSSTNDFIILMAMVLVVVYLAKNIYLFIMYKLQFRFVFNNQMRLSTRLMDCYLKKSYEYHANKNSAEIIRSVTDDVSRLFQLVLNALMLLTEGLVIICVGTLLVIIEPVMTLSVIVLLGIALVVFMVMYKKILAETGVKNQKSYGAMIKWINQGIGGIKEIKVLNREQFFIDEYSKAADGFAEAQRKYNFLTQVPKLFIESLCICSMLIVISVMLYNGRDVSALLPQLAAFAVAAFRIMPSFNRITMCYNGVVFNTAAIDLVYHDLKENDGKLNSDFVDEKIIFNDDSSIMVNNLSYRYPNTATDVIKRVSLKIPLKKSIAIIGSSGAGKTTLADILLGLLKPTIGTITVNGTDIHRNINEWSKKLGYIPQSIYLCDDTIKSNVAFGIYESEIDEDKVWVALEKAQLKNFVDSLPESINTIIGERGVKLSGGQRQRMGIARAFYNDPEVLLFDEATSSLDNDTEAAVMEAIDSVKNEKTLIIIAHRLSTTKNCDMTFMVDDGGIEAVNK